MSVCKKLGQEYLRILIFSSRERERERERELRSFFLLIVAAAAALYSRVLNMYNFRAYVLCMRRWRCGEGKRGGGTALAPPT